MCSPTGGPVAGSDPRGPQGGSRCRAVPALAAAGELAEIAGSRPATIVASEDAQKIVATTEAAPPAIWLEDVEPATSKAAASIATYETAMDDVALLLPVQGPDGAARLAAHTHDSCLRGASRGRHWLGAGRRDQLWCTAEVGTSEFVTTVLGAWAQDRGGAPRTARRAGQATGGPRAAAGHDPRPVRRASTARSLRTAAAPSTTSRGARGHLPGRTGLGGRPRDLPRPVRHLDRTCYETAGERPGRGRSPRRGGAHTGSVGVPLPGSRVGVIDENGTEVEPGEAGDLAVAEGAPGLFVGYWDDRDATDSVFRSNWFLTGDRAVREPGDVVRLAFPAEVRALDDRRRTAADARHKAAAEELRRQKEPRPRRHAFATRRRARREDERRRRDAERQTKAEERARRDEARAEERRRLEEEKRQVVELKVAAERRRQTEQAARRRQERDVRQAEKEASDRARAADRVVAEARTRRSRSRSANRLPTASARGPPPRRRRTRATSPATRPRPSAARPNRSESARRRSSESRNAPAPRPRSAREEARRAEEAERRRAEEERKRQAAVDREQERTRAEAEKRAREEARRAEEAERRRAEEERKRQREPNGSGRRRSPASRRRSDRGRPAGRRGPTQTRPASSPGSEPTASHRRTAACRTTTAGRTRRPELAPSGPAPRGPAPSPRQAVVRWRARGRRE